MTTPAMVALGLGTWAVEAATAVPYLGAVALLTAAGLSPAQWVVILAVYCVAMLAPCLILYAATTLAGDRLRPRLERWRERSTTGSRATLSWIIGIAGVLVLRDSVSRLSGIDAIGLGF